MLTLFTFLENKPTVKKHFDELGGYATVSELCSLVNPENVDAYYDKIAKMNFHKQNTNVASALSRPLINSCG